MLTTFDDDRLRAAMAAYLEAARRLDAQAAVRGSDGAEARTLLDLAEAKSLAGMRLARRLTDLGWTAPAPAAAAPVQEPAEA